MRRGRALAWVYMIHRIDPYSRLMERAFHSLAYHDRVTTYPTLHPCWS
jgi:hypothetical protein